MTENFRACIAVIFLSLIVFGFAGRSLRFEAERVSPLYSRFLAWLLISAAVFLSHSFWIFITLCAVIIIHANFRDNNPLALYCFLLLAAPPIKEEIPGFGVVNYFFEVDYLRVLNIIILGLLIPKLKFRRWYPTDFLILLYIGFPLIMSIREDSLTNSMRQIFLSIVDVGLPYLAASRAFKDMRQLVDAIRSFVLGALLVAAIAIFEVTKGWLLYASVDSFLSVHWDYNSYLGRDGFVRATASAGHPIVLGYVLAVAILLWCGIRGHFVSGRASIDIIMIILIFGLMAALSRGPILGVILGWIVFRLCTSGSVAGVFKYLAVSIVVAGTLWISPVGEIIKPYVPFIGTVDAANVDYRERLLENSIDLIIASPWTGVHGFHQSLSDRGMMQGQGIVDIVNTYIAIALSFGLPLLGVFISIFLVQIFDLSRVLGVNSPSAKNNQTLILCASLIGVAVAILIIIFTVSSILIIPLIYWFIIGAIGGLSRFESEVRKDFVGRLE